MFADIQLQIDPGVEELTRQLEIKKEIACTRVFRLNIINIIYLGNKFYLVNLLIAKVSFFFPILLKSNKEIWVVNKNLNR